VGRYEFQRAQPDLDHGAEFHRARYLHPSAQRDERRPGEPDDNVRSNHGAPVPELVSLRWPERIPQ
jgi:hypothetical protein